MSLQDNTFEAFLKGKITQNSSNRGMINSEQLNCPHDTHDEISNDF